MKVSSSFSIAVIDRIPYTSDSKEKQLFGLNTVHRGRAVGASRRWSNTPHLKSGRRESRKWGQAMNPQSPPPVSLFSRKAPPPTNSTTFPKVTQLVFKHKRLWWTFHPNHNRQEAKDKWIQYRASWLLDLGMLMYMGLNYIIACKLYIILNVVFVCLCGIGGQPQHHEHLGNHSVIEPHT